VAEFAPAEWPAAVDKMVPRAKIDATERDLIVRYLVTMSDPRTEGPSGQSRGAMSSRPTLPGSGAPAALDTSAMPPR
jgi:hypothetical protein